jgi:DNA-binding PadR family transcriptional regulator
MKKTEISALGYALLGLINLEASSGYELRKIFAETAMGNYSSSPGAIYPALKRLESQRLIRGEVEDSAGLRRRRIYHATPAGGAKLRQWLSKPIEQGDVMRGAQELMLRFSFMDHALGNDAAVSFLQNFRVVLKIYLSSLEAYARENSNQMPLSGRLALESGIRGYRGMYEWTAYAVRAYRQSIASRTAPRGVKSARPVINRPSTGTTKVLP